MGGGATMKKTIVADESIASANSTLISDDNLDSNPNALNYDEIIALKYKENFDKKIEVKAKRNAIIFVIQRQKTLGDKGKISLGENEILFTKSGSFRAINAISKVAGIHKSYCIFFSNIFLLKFLSRHKYLLDLLTNREKISVYKTRSNIYIGEQISSLSVYFANKNKLNANVFKEIMTLKTEILFLLLINHKDSAFANFVCSILDSHPFLRTLLENSDKKFGSVKEMAEVFDMNISLFSKKFKTNLGISPKEWLDNEKFEHAKLLIEFSNKNVTEVCKELQINSIAWFIERFRARYGITPKQLQKSHNLHFGK